MPKYEKCERCGKPGNAYPLAGSRFTTVVLCDECWHGNGEPEKQAHRHEAWPGVNKTHPSLLVDSSPLRQIWATVGRNTRWRAKRKPALPSSKQ